jgi:hypothetical protein
VGVHRPLPEQGVEPLVDRRGVADALVVRGVLYQPAGPQDGEVQVLEPRRRPGLEVEDQGVGVQAPLTPVASGAAPRIAVGRPERGLVGAVDAGDRPVTAHPRPLSRSRPATAAGTSMIRSCSWPSRTPSRRA